MNIYDTRINRVLDYIDLNISEKINLNQLAEVACFSPFHFLRLFQAHTGERPFEFIHRLRLEKAARMLKTRPDLKIIEIGLECGFSNAASFSRAFKETMGVSPSQWKKKEVSKNLFEKKNISEEKKYIWNIDNVFANGKNQKWRMNFEGNKREVIISKEPSIDLVYLRYTGPYKGDGELFTELWNRLYRWAAAHELISEESIFLSLYPDDPELTDDSKLRVTVAVSTSKEFEASDGMGKLHFEGGLTASCLFYLDTQGYQKAWNWMYQEWLPRSGYIPDEKPAFERFPREKQKCCDNLHAVEICIPVLPE